MPRVSTCSYRPTCVIQPKKRIMKTWTERCKSRQFFNEGEVNLIGLTRYTPVLCWAGRVQAQGYHSGWDKTVWRGIRQFNSFLQANAMDGAINEIVYENSSSKIELSNGHSSSEYGRLLVERRFRTKRSILVLIRKFKIENTLIKAYIKEQTTFKPNATRAGRYNKIEISFQLHT